MPARSVCLATLSPSEAGPGRFGGQASVTGIYHTTTIPYHGASIVVKMATDSPCGGASMVCVRRQRRLWQPMAPHRRMAPVGTLDTIATAYGVAATDI